MKRFYAVMVMTLLVFAACGGPQSPASPTNWEEGWGAHVIGGCFEKNCGKLANDDLVDIDRQALADAIHGSKSTMVTYAYCDTAYYCGASRDTHKTELWAAYSNGLYSNGFATRPNREYHDDPLIAGRYYDNTGSDYRITNSVSGNNAWPCFITADRTAARAAFMAKFKEQHPKKVFTVMSSTVTRGWDATAQEWVNVIE